MEPTDPHLALRVEKIRLTWEYNKQLAEVRRQGYWQIFTGLVGLAVGAVASTLFDKVPPSLGAAVLFGCVLGGIWIHLRLRELSRELRTNLDVALDTIETLIAVVKE